MPEDTYTHGHHESVVRSHSARTAANSAPHLLPLLAPGQRLLDVGCGPGTISMDLAEIVAPGEVVATDLAAPVIVTAQANLERARSDGRSLDNLRFETGDVYAIDAADDSFDVVHAHQVLQHVSDPVAALAEMRRVCRPGGIVAVADADYGAMFWAPESPALEKWQSVYRAVARKNDAEPDAARHLLAWALEAGFTREQVSVAANTWVFADAATRGRWGATWAERTVASALGEQAVSYGIASDVELAEIAEGWRAWAATDDGFFAVVNGQMICRP